MPDPPPYLPPPPPPPLPGAPPPPVPGRTFDALPDPADFRDRLFEPTLVEVPRRVELAAYREVFRRGGAPVLNQGAEGACTGFALATVAHYLLRRLNPADVTRVSPHMLYAMARRYDERPGEGYSGSSARGAMKGWHKHGVCTEKLWRAGDEAAGLTEDRARNAACRPLGAYYRINPKDLVAMHCALFEVGVLYATAAIHEGWNEVGADGRVIPPEGGRRPRYAHAFAIVAYDREGFWFQNSWGEGWGAGGFGHLSYDDWLDHALDVWVARLGVPVRLRRARSAAVSLSDLAGKTETVAFNDVRPHVLHVGEDGRLLAKGAFGTGEEDARRVFEEHFPRLTAGWKRKRLMLYAPGGLTAEKSTVQRVADYRSQLLANEVYPLAFVWYEDFWGTIAGVLERAVRRLRPEGEVEGAKDFLLDRLDDALEPLARSLAGPLLWRELKERGVLATRTSGSAGGAGAGRVVLDHLARLLESEPEVEIHLAAHGAGAVFLAPLAQLLTARELVESGPMAGRKGAGLAVSSCLLWAPACTTELFRRSYLPAFESGALERFALYTLTDEAERQDHVAHIYNKSILYLVSQALETVEPAAAPGSGPEAPLLGLERSLRRDEELWRLFVDHPRASWVRAPNDAPLGSIHASRARCHGDFEDDEATLRSSLARLLGVGEADGGFDFHRSASRLQERRRRLPGGA